MEFISLKVADISTAHISEKDSDLLGLSASYCRGEDQPNHPNLPCTVTEYEDGFFVNLANFNLDELHITCRDFSPEFQNVIRKAKEAGFDLINFDRDGETYEELHKFDW